MSEHTNKHTETHACDLIERQTAIDALDKIFDSIPMEQTTEILTLRRALRELPSAPTEIIRCKDCKHYKTYISCIGDEYSGCDYWINDGNESLCEPTDFCSYAERKTDD